MSDWPQYGEFCGARSSPVAYSNRVEGLESKLSDSSSPSINKKKESSKESKDVGVVYL